MPKQFCKVFGPENDQVLVLRDHGPTGPRVRILVDPNLSQYVGLMSIPREFPDTDAGVIQARMYFDSLSGARCMTAIQTALNTLGVA